MGGREWKEGWKGRRGGEGNGKKGREEGGEGKKAGEEGNGRLSPRIKILATASDYYKSNQPIS